ncbi:MAG: hypothetical protein M5U13_06520 [Thermoanaerobaculia bacterium]|nr:hypothetical protein [Thermoanaerobaculia bacterium]
MRRPPSAPRPFRALRRLVLGLLLLALATLAGLYWLGGSRPATPEREREGRPELGGATAVSEGFEYTQVLEGEPVFRIRGDRFRAAEGDRVELEGVGLTLFRQGREVGVESERALYLPGRNEAVLSGTVRILGERGISLSSPELMLAEGARLLVSEQPVGFAFSGGEGTAGNLIVDFDRSSVAFGGPLELAGRDAAGERYALSSNGAVLERDARLLRAEGAVELRFGRSQLRAQRFSVLFADEAGTLQQVHASLEVTGELLGPQGEAAGAVPFTVDAHTVNLQFEEGGRAPARIEIEGTAGRTAILVARDAAGVARVLLSRSVVGRFAGGELAAVETIGASELQEYLETPGEESRLLRSAAARFMTADLAADRSLSTVTLTEEVTMRDERVEARADRAFVQAASDSVQLLGEPAVVIDARGELRAPRIDYQRGPGRARAEGGVTGLFREAPLPGTAGDPAAEEPTRVQAREGFFDLGSDDFVFRGEVRAYQGTTVLFADQLRSEEGQSRLSAAGGVRTLWRSEEGGEPEEPVEVTAGSLTFRDAERRLLYDGAVRVVQGPRVLTAASLEVELDGSRRARQMTARGGIRLEDAATGRTVEGDTARHDLASRTVTVDGAPALVRDTDGNLLKGRRLVYELESGAMRVGAGEGK